MKRAAAVACLLVAASAAPFTQTREPPRNKELEGLHAHFEQAVRDRHDRAFSSITTVEQWERRKQEISGALHRMLWSDMRWPDAPPPARVTHREQHPAYTIENVVLETAPGVFLTSNLYLPGGTGPFPVVLYQCGHANKSYFKRHGAWFATHGIAALVMDNIEMGEIEFTHHGVYSRGWFHWYSRGFSPLAVELLNARRAVDYLAARPDIDRQRIGATGRSGGGMATFFLAAIDGRIKASAPVSGTLSTTGWMTHRLTPAHGDCQYPVNSYGLLYSEIGAMIAPRVQLMVNADADRGFPMDAFTEMVAKMREIYRLHGATDALQTAVTPGGHTDTEAIRLPVYSFFSKQFLGKDAPVTSEGDVDEPVAEELTCFRTGLPIDERLTRIDEELIPMSRARPGKPDELTEHLRREVFRYFPDKPAPLQPEWSQPTTLQARTIRVRLVSAGLRYTRRCRELYRCLDDRFHSRPANLCSEFTLLRSCGLQNRALTSGTILALSARCPMGWFRVASNRLRYRGRLSQEPYLAWAKTSDGSATIDARARENRLRLFARSRARRRIWRELERAARSEPLCAAIQSEADHFATAIVEASHALGLPRRG